MAKYLSFYLLFVCASVSCSDPRSCQGRCGQGYYKGSLCHCDFECLGLNECCSDFESLCTTKNSCEGRCGEPFNRGNLCHCDFECTTYNQCCSDYESQCLVEDLKSRSTSTPARRISNSCLNITTKKNAESSNEDMSAYEELEEGPAETTPSEVEGSTITITTAGLPCTTSPGGPTITISLEVPTNTTLSDGPANTTLADGPTTIILSGGSTSTITTEESTSTISSESPTTIILSEGTTTIIPTEGSTSTITTEGLTTITSEGTTVTEDPTTTVPTEEPTTTVPTEEPTTTVTTESPTSTVPTESPTTTVTTEEPTTIITTEMPTSTIHTESTTSTEPTTTVITEMPTSTVPTEEPTTTVTTESSTTTVTTESSTTTVTTESSTTPVTTEMPTSTIPKESTTRTEPTEGPAINQQIYPTEEDPGLTVSITPTQKPTEPTSVNDKIEIDKNYQADDYDANLCSGRPISALTTLRNGTIVVFRGHYFWTLDKNRNPDPARLITNVWGIPSPIDTVFTRCNCQGKTYFFKGNKYWRFEDGTMDPGFPKHISQGFGRINHITAALSIPQYRSRYESVIFFRRGGLAQKYTYQVTPSCGSKPMIPLITVRNRLRRDIVSSLGTVINISRSWRGFPSTVTSAVSVPSRVKEGHKYYVFSQKNYFSMKMERERPVILKAANGQRENTANSFFKCPQSNKV